MTKYSLQLFAQRSLLGLGAFALLGPLSPSIQAAETATATISSTPVSPGENQYTLTLNDTGSTTLGTFWFAWIPGDNFMPVSPANIMSPAGWTEKITSGGPSKGYAIQWKATGNSDDVAAGNSLSGFSFDSSLTMAQLEAPASGNPSDPVFTAFVYSTTPFSDAGFQLTPSVGAATPEPGSIGLALIGVSLTIYGIRKRKTYASASVQR